jgi:menaquinone-dependent protoporphyrinogen IX oxidase
MVKRIYHWSPHHTKKAAEQTAKTLMKKGQKVRITKADLYSKQRGFRYDVTVVGTRRRR